IANDGLTITSGSRESWKDDLKRKESPRCFVYSLDGTYLALVFEQNVEILNARTLEIVKTLEVKNVIEAEFSPKGKYLSTWVRFVKGEEGAELHKNLVIWETATGEEVMGLSQKTQNGWNVNWTPNESLFARLSLTASELQFFNPLEPASKIVSRLKIENLKSFSFSPNKTGPQTVGVFVGERKGAPAAVRLFDLKDLEKEGTGEDVKPKAVRTFFNADSVDFKWNADGTAVLIVTHTEVDKTGKSYYGKSQVFHMSTLPSQSATTDSNSGRVELGDGPIHHVSWSPNSKEFLILHGPMPALATLFDHRGEALYNFPPAPRNMALYSPHGRFIVIAGFGNLAGDVDVWDRLTFQKAGTFRAPNASSISWAADGRCLMTVTLYRRLKVDNGVRVWHYTGSLLHKVDVKELHQCSWRFEEAKHFPLRKGAGLSPPPKGISAGGSGEVEAEKKPVGVYRPPGARARGGAVGFRMERGTES
ncbi:hypothetical protein HDV05_008521, partial [Chytridiales sp. JEL 0842]